MNWLKLHIYSFYMRNALSKVGPFTKIGSVYSTDELNAEQVAIAMARSQVLLPFCGEVASMGETYIGETYIGEDYMLSHSSDMVWRH